MDVFDRPIAKKQDKKVIEKEQVPLEDKKFE